MQPQLREYISIHLPQHIKDIHSVSGGDISEAYRIGTASADYFCKVNSSASADALFTAEEKGLQEISKSKTIATPQVILRERVEKTGFILMEFVPSKSGSSSEMRLLGEQLAAMHSTFSEKFGLATNNFIGSLKQSNTQHNGWTDFYLLERLIPQLKMSRDKGLLSQNEIPAEGPMWNTLDQLFPEIKPSLLHGDLWSGNYLISTSGTPYLIDPAAYYGHYEVDLAMSKLFGGFTQPFYEGHQTVFKLQPEADARMDIYQLYYLLVHLNLFGSSYYGSVNRILKKYF